MKSVLFALALLASFHTMAAEKVIRVSVTAAANITDNRIEILETVEDENFTEEMGCALTLTAGQVITYKMISGSEMNLQTEFKNLTYVSNAKNNVWTNVSFENGLKVVSMVTIGKGKYSNTVECSLK